MTIISSIIFITLFLEFIILCQSICKNQERCQQIDIIDVYLTAHSHLDAYWLQTYEEYYYGNGTDGIHKWVKVKSLYNYALSSLSNSDVRTALFSEISFFSLWWQESTEQERQKFKQLVNEGRIEFITGGWVQPDEPLSYYEDLIDIYILGHQFLKQNLQAIVNVASCNDGFGHTAGSASLFSAMGINAHIVERVSDERRHQYMDSKKMEFLWEPEVSVGVFKDSMFTHIQRPHDTRFWERQGLNQNQCENLKNSLSSFASLMKEMGKGMQDNQIFYYSGNDWTILDEQFYQKHDIMIDYFNDNPCSGVAFKYSNASTYFKNKMEKAKEKQNQQWHVLKTDLIPYQYATYWTGYYSSQPNIKLIIRQSARYLHAVRNFFSKIILWSINDSKNTSINQTQIVQNVNAYEQEIALHHHHDGITSTSKYRVLDIAVNRMKNSFQLLKKVEQEMLAIYVQKESKFCKTTKFLSCNYLENDKCFDVLRQQEQQYIMSIFNPAQQRLDIIELNIPKQVDYEIFDEDNQIVPSEVICIMQNENYCSLFIKQELYPFSINIFLLKKKQNANDILNLAAIEFQKNENQKEININNNNKITVDSQLSNFSISQCGLQDSQQCKTFHFSLQYSSISEKCYQGVKDLEGITQFFCGGKYVMQNDIKTLQQISNPKKVLFVKGKLLTIIKIEYDQYAVSVLKYIPDIMKNGINLESYLDFNSNSNNNDYMLVIKSNNITSNDEFYTDSNGLYMVKRKFNNYEDLQHKFEEAYQVSSNVYPITSQCLIEDQTSGTRMVVISDRAQGVTSLGSGTLNLFVERKAGEDTFGVGESLYKLEKQRYHYTILFTPKEEYGQERIVQQSKEQTYLISIANNIQQYGESQYCTPKQKSKQTFQFSQDFKVIARPQGDNQFLIRLENINSAKTIQITHFNNENINYVLSTIAGNNLYSNSFIEEYALNGALTLKEMKKSKWHWNKSNEDALKGIENYDSNPKQEIELKPFQIRMFLVNVSSAVNQGNLLCHSFCQSCINNMATCVNIQTQTDIDEMKKQLEIEKQQLEEMKKNQDEKQKYLEQLQKQQEEQQKQMQDQFKILEEMNKNNEQEKKRIEELKKNLDEDSKNYLQQQKLLDEYIKLTSSLQNRSEEIKKIDELKDALSQNWEVLKNKQKQLEEDLAKQIQSQKEIQMKEKLLENNQKNFLDRLEILLKQQKELELEKKLNSEQQQKLLLKMQLVDEEYNQRKPQDFIQFGRKYKIIYFGYAFLIIYIIFSRIQQINNEKMKLILHQQRI